MDPFIVRRLLTVILIVPVAILGQRNGDSPAAALLMIPLGLIAAVLVLSVLFYFPAAFTRMAVGERFGAAFEVADNLAYLRRNIMNYLLAIVIMMAVPPLLLCWIWCALLR